MKPVGLALYQPILWFVTALADRLGYHGSEARRLPGDHRRDHRSQPGHGLLPPPSRWSEVEVASSRPFPPHHAGQRPWAPTPRVWLRPGSPNANGWAEAVPMIEKRPLPVELLLSLLPQPRCCPCPPLAKANSRPSRTQLSDPSRQARMKLTRPSRPVLPARVPRRPSHSHLDRLRHQE